MLKLSTHDPTRAAPVMGIPSHWGHVDGSEVGGARLIANISGGTHSPKATSNPTGHAHTVRFITDSWLGPQLTHEAPFQIEVAVQGRHVRPPVGVSDQFGGQLQAYPPTKLVQLWLHPPFSTKHSLMSTQPEPLETGLYPDGHPPLQPGGASSVPTHMEPTCENTRPGDSGHCMQSDPTLPAIGLNVDGGQLAHAPMPARVSDAG